MSSQKGNTARTRPQKHQNRRAFSNTLHDTSQRTKFLNSVQVVDVCLRCKEIIEWKIKYKKYKPLTQPRKCVKCDQKTVKKAYHVMCTECGKKLGVCTKCCQNKEIVQSVPSQQEQIQMDNEMKAVLQSLPERKRRTFFRFLEKQNKETDQQTSKDSKKDTLMTKLNNLAIEDSDNDDFSEEESENYSSDSED